MQWPEQQECLGTLGCHEPLLVWVGCAGERQMDKEGIRDFTMVDPFISLPLCPDRDFRLLQPVAASVAVLRDSQLVTGWEMRVSGFSPDLISHPRGKR